MAILLDLVILFSYFELLWHASKWTLCLQTCTCTRAGYCLYTSMLWDYNIIVMPMESPKSEKPRGGGKYVPSISSVLPNLFLILSCTTIIWMVCDHWTIDNFVIEQQTSLQNFLIILSWRDNGTNYQKMGNIQ